MKQKEITELLDGLFEFTNIKESQIKNTTKRRLVECMDELKYIHKKLNAIDKKKTLRSYILEFTKRDILINYKGLQDSILEYCRMKGYSPYFREGEEFQAHRNASPKFVEYVKIPNTSVLFLTLGHEIGHCISYSKANAIMRSSTFEENKHHTRLRSNDLMEELLSWYEGLEMCKNFMDKGYPILKGFSSFDEICDYINLCLLSHSSKKSSTQDKFIPQKAILINREKVREIIGTKVKFST